MYTIRLFHRDDPFSVLDARRIESGELSIGRDFESDWVVADQERTVSRRHAVFSVKSGRLVVRDVSANGVFRDPGRQRLPLNQDVASDAGDVLRFGQFIIAVDKDDVMAGEEAPPVNKLPAAANDLTCGFSQSLGAAKLAPLAVNVPSDWSDSRTHVDSQTTRAEEGGLLEAFCAGARLDPSAFAGEDAHDVLRRAGAFYQQSVLGLADLIQERSAMKTDYALERTSIGSAGNNPIKWAAPQRLAIDLLCDGDGQFLKDAAAANEAFTDIKRHLVCLTASLRAALDEVLSDLAPDSIRESSRVKGLALKREGERCWAEYEHRFATIADPESGSVEQKVRAAYQRRMATFG